MNSKSKALESAKSKTLEIKSHTPNRYHLKKTVKRGRAVFKGVSHETEN